VRFPRATRLSPKRPPRRPRRGCECGRVGHFVRVIGNVISVQLVNRAPSPHAPRQPPRTRSRASGQITAGAALSCSAAPLGRVARSSAFRVRGRRHRCRVGADRCPSGAQVPWTAPPDLRTVATAPRRHASLAVSSRPRLLKRHESAASAEASSHHVHDRAAREGQDADHGSANIAILRKPALTIERASRNTGMVPL
jgi:hypothetical protein